ncbi:MAG: prepilin-type N-terminal cleavage/methylation domain-containing protein [Candidatus Cloacimonetes bacterium]|nr:prepilin-type N-terminal cleavage/methylation domain-containing protein [Candidatus Cloacimonadota bacterium]
MKSKSYIQKGFTLTEILIALSVLAFAFVPLMGVMWSGVKRTDVSAAYENAGNIGASVLEFMLADSVRFSDIDFSNPTNPALRAADNGAAGTASKESSGILASSPNFTPTINEFLGEACATNDADGICTDGSSKSRYFKIGRTNFYTDMYVGAYYENIPGAAANVKTHLDYRYFRNPSIDYEGDDVAGESVPQRYYDTMILDNTVDLVRFSPYSPAEGWSIAPSAYETDTRSDKQLSLMIPDDPLAAYTTEDSAKYANFSKIQLFVRWGYNWLNRVTGATAGDAVMSARSLDSRGKAKMIQLVTFKGRFE